MLLERIDTGLLLPLAAGAEDKQNTLLISNLHSGWISEAEHNVCIRMTCLSLLLKVH